MSRANDEANQLDQLYKEIILEHYKSPHNKGTINNPDASVWDNNPLCGDEITITAKINKGVISDVRVDPKGCSISVASASMLTDTVKGQTVVEAKKWIKIIKDMMHSDLQVSDDELGDLESLKGVANFPVRIKCALLSWMTLLKLLENHKGGQ
ncbi:MAG: SUF system NifU family Fe-S cluster assembly protein [Planctomycetes bacterium]|nr:SUF system NifU family Fe-S cluster assembly protein [Planctomycetota bacterium]